MATAFQHMSRSATLPPLALIAQAIPSLSRHDLAALTERLIDRLDEIDPDPDLEPDGDEEDGSMDAEDEFMRHPDHLPGCPIADPGGPNGDDELSLHPPTWPTVD